MSYYYKRMGRPRTEKTKKILSCYGHLKASSVARLYNVSYSYVYNVWRQAGCFEEDGIYYGGL